MRIPMGLLDDELGGNALEELEPQHERPALAPDLLFVPEVHEIEVGRRAVRRFGRRVDAEHDLLDLEFGVGGPGGHGGDFGAVPLERGIRELGLQEPEAPGPVLLDGGAAARVEVVDEPVEEVLGRGIERVGLGGSAPASRRRITPKRTQQDRKGPEPPVRLDGLAPDPGVLTAGIAVSCHRRISCGVRRPGRGVGQKPRRRRPPAR